MEGNLLVTPEQLETTAEEFNTAMTQVASITEEMVSIVSGTNAVWQGEAATSFTNQFNQLADDIELIKSKINEHVTDLKDMAAVYRDAETVNQEAASALSGDVLV